MNKCMRSLSLALMCTAMVGAVQAAEDGWTFEITPYAWLAGIDADVTVKGREFEVDQKFSDLIEHVDAAASLIVVAENDRWEAYGQADYFSLSAADTRNGVHGEIESEAFILTAGGGYQFEGPIDGSTIAVLLGIRHASLDNEVTVGGASGSKTTDLNDALLILRPSIPITAKLRFNPTVNFGAGDSDFTYELQPEFQYNFTDMVAGRLGYRRVNYKEDKGDDSEFDGGFSGLIIGLGVTL